MLGTRSTDTTTKTKKSSPVIPSHFCSCLLISRPPPSRGFELGAYLTTSAEFSVTDQTEHVFVSRHHADPPHPGDDRSYGRPAWGTSTCTTRTSPVRLAICASAFSTPAHSASMRNSDRPSG